MASLINPKDQEEAALSGVTIVTPTEILATHLLEVIKRNFSRLLTLKSLRRLLAEMVNISDPGRAEANRKLLEELIPDKVPVDVLHAVLRLLLEEQVSIRNLPLILEAVAEARGQNAKPDAICEHVRQRLGFQLVAEMRREDGSLPLIQLAPEWEDAFTTYQIDSDRGGLDIALPPDLFNRLADAVSTQLTEANERGVYPALITSTRRRRFLRTVMRAKGISNPVLSFEEIGADAHPALVGVVAA
jgi:flagellar biosynthesis protein FlhA